MLFMNDLTRSELDKALLVHRNLSGLSAPSRWEDMYLWSGQMQKIFPHQGLTMAVTPVRILASFSKVSRRASEKSMRFGRTKLTRQNQRNRGFALFGGHQRDPTVKNPVLLHPWVISNPPFIGMIHLSLETVASRDNPFKNHR
jgi:hypothetical protein